MSSKMGSSKLQTSTGRRLHLSMSTWAHSNSKLSSLLTGW